MWVRKERGQGGGEWRNVTKGVKIEMESKVRGLGVMWLECGNGRKR